MADEDGAVDVDLLRRLQRRVQNDRSRQKKRATAPEPNRKPGRTLPQVRPLHMEIKRSEASTFSGVHYFLESTAAGKSVADMLPSPAFKGTLKMEPSFDENASPEDLKVVERMFQQRVEEQRRSRHLVQQLNEKPDEVNDDDHQRPDSPGKEYDLQYMQYAIQAPRFRASVHEKTLAMHGMTSHDQQKFLSSAKDVEESLHKEHARYAEDGSGAQGPKAKRRRVPKTPRSKKVA